MRKHLSRIKGGQLAAMAAPAKVIALILSDVIGDNLDVIGSGPTAPDVSTVDDARASTEVKPGPSKTPRPRAEAAGRCRGFPSDRNVDICEPSLAVAESMNAARQTFVTVLPPSPKIGIGRK